VPEDNQIVPVIRKPALRGLAFLLPMLLFASGFQPTIEDTGSTNRPGLRVTIGHDGNATVEPRHGEIQHVKLPESLCNRFLRDLKEAGPVSALPARHCIKSVSFGSSLFIEWNDDRSPDLSCSGQHDARVDTLQRDAQEILQAAREAAGIRPGRIFTVRAPNPPKS
jgi:hypothetical protein